MNQHSTYDSHGWLLAAGALFAAIGLWREPVQGSGSDDNGTSSTQTPTATPPVAMAATADSNNRMIAVTGTDITGASILYLVDTLNDQLAVYQAVGGGESTQGVKFVGARRIDLDLKVDGYKDRSEFSYKKLRDEFSKKGLLSNPSSAANANEPQH